MGRSPVAFAVPGVAKEREVGVSLSSSKMSISVRVQVLYEAKGHFFEVTLISGEYFHWIYNSGFKTFFF